jgi:hypothetical protein
MSKQPSSDYDLSDDEIDSFIDNYSNHLAKRRECLATHITPEVLSYLEEQFQTSLPCFQTINGSFDPLDAMRRDAHREVILWIQNEIKLYNQNGSI